MARKGRSAAATKAHNQIVAEMIEGGKQAVAIMRSEADPTTYRVHLPDDVDVKAIRSKTGLSQDAFAGIFGFATGTVRDWEQRRYTPDPTARAYLYVIAQQPDLVRKTLAPLARADVARSVKRFKLPIDGKAPLSTPARKATPQKQKRSPAFASERRGDRHAHR
jgi:putative transcriptional regulator